MACVVCKQSLMNAHEIDLHSKFHLANCSNQKNLSKTVKTDGSSTMITIKCNQCHRSTNTNRNFLLELPSFSINCFQCIEKELKSTGKKKYIRK